MSSSQQRDLLLQTLASIHLMDFQIWTYGSAWDGIEDGRAGLVVLSQDGLIYEWHDPTCTHSGSFQVETATLKNAIQWLSSISSWVSAIIICDCKSLVQAISNANSTDSSVIQLQVQQQYSPCQNQSWSCRLLDTDLSDNQLADQQAKLGAAKTKSDNALEPVTRRALIRRSCRPLPSNMSGIRRGTPLPDELIETSFAKTERTDLARFRSGHHLVPRDLNGSRLFAAGLPTDTVGSQNFQHFSTRQTQHFGDWWGELTTTTTLLYDAGGIWLESPRVLSADCVMRKSNLQNTHGYDVRRVCWNDTIATLTIRWKYLFAFHMQL